MKKNWMRLAIMASLGTFALPNLAPAADLDLTAVVELLREEGVITEEQYESMYEKAQERSAESSWTDRITLSGDLRARIETFQFRRSANDVGMRDRTRARYRARLNIRAAVNDHIDAILRIASGEGSNTSTNTSFGRNVDSGPDGIFLDRAFIRWTPHADGSLIEGQGWLAAEVGRVPNPFMQKGIGKEVLLWDGDLNFTGGSVRTEYPLANFADLMLNSGYYIIDEEGGAQDPAMFAIQGSSTFHVGDAISLGARSSFYNFVNLNNGFRARGAEVGNLVNGLTDDQAVSVVAAKLFAKIDVFDSWPITLFGQVSSNLTAEKVAGAAGREDLAWLVGVEVGDKKKFLQLGMIYGQVQANAFPAQFQDSDWFDGVTNRKGFAWWGKRQVYPNTDLQLTIFHSKEIENRAVYSASVPGARRTRVQGDVVVKF